MWVLNSGHQLDMKVIYLLSHLASPNVFLTTHLFLMIPSVYLKTHAVYDTKD